MPVFQTQKNSVLFLHIPKTGGSSIERAFMARSRMTLASLGESFQSAKPLRTQLAVGVAAQHWTFRDLRFVLGPEMPAARCCVVRNPYDRLESSYAYARKLGQKNAEKPFSSWVLYQLARTVADPHHSEGHFLPQCMYTGPDVNIFRFEDGLQPVLNWIEEALGLGPGEALPHENSSHRDTITWSRAARLEVNRFYAEDFRTLGYVPVDSDAKRFDPVLRCFRIASAQARISARLLRRVWFPGPHKVHFGPEEENIGV